MHQRAARSEDTLRLSCDAKAPVLIGPFSRGGKSRRGTKGADHDFKPWGKLTPFGIFLPDQRELNFYFTSSKVTSDFIVDRLDQWWQGNRERYPQIRKLLLDLDNGPENHSHRSQFIYRLVQWAQATQLTLELVYYPPRATASKIPVILAVLDGNLVCSYNCTIETFLIIIRIMVVKVWNTRKTFDQSLCLDFPIL